MVPSALQPTREFSRRRGLAGALQTRQQEHRWNSRRKFQFRGGAAQQLDQLIPYDLHDLLCRREAVQDFLALAFDSNILDQLLDDLDLHVGFEQSETDLPQRLGHVLFSELGFAPKSLKHVLELLA